MQMAKFLWNVFKNCNKNPPLITDDNVHKNRVGYQTPRVMSLTVMHTVVIDNTWVIPEKMISLIRALNFSWKTYLPLQKKITTDF